MGHDEHCRRKGQPMAAPESLAVKPPDELLITNPVFETEIRVQAEALGFQCRTRVLD